MNWFNLSCGVHINLDYVEIFCWKEGELHIAMKGYREADRISDPDKKEYTRLCRHVYQEDVGI
ncbi:MAG: hypothetical protein IJX67_10865 [Oscillospiraceae bacterium]|nr:hypothetical protein [Oscillospiraceae bacterium]